MQAFRCFSKPQPPPPPLFIGIHTLSSAAAPNRVVCGTFNKHSKHSPSERPFTSTPFSATSLRPCLSSFSDLPFVYVFSRSVAWDNLLHRIYKVYVCMYVYVCVCVCVSVCECVCTSVSVQPSYSLISSPFPCPSPWRSADDSGRFLMTCGQPGETCDARSGRAFSVKQKQNRKKERKKHIHRQGCDPSIYTRWSPIPGTHPWREGYGHGG